MPLEFKSWKDIDIIKIREEIERDRIKVSEILEGKIPEKMKDLVKTILFIVESPNKARTIASFFGKPSKRKVKNLDVYEVTIGDKVLMIVATKGHIFDLTTEEIPDAYYGVLLEDGKFIPYYTTIKRCKDCGFQWTEERDKCPRCSSENIEDSKERIEALKELAREADIILIGTDPDSVDGKSLLNVKINGKEFEKTFEDLFNELKDKEECFSIDDHEYIKPKDLYVRAVDPETLTIIWAKVNYIIRHKIKRKIYTIKTKNGNEISVTGDHSLFTFKTKYELVEFKEGRGPIINYLIYSDELEKITKNKEILSKFISRATLYEDEIKDILKRVGGQFVKVFIPELKVAIPVYFYGISKENNKEIFSIPLRRKAYLKEVRAEFLKKGDKIVIVKDGKVILDEIVEIEEKVYEGYVYDMDTEVDNFIANNVVCHNTEGEFIAWSVYLAIKPFSKKLYRAEFHEVTRSSILKALKELKEINLNRVKAQIVRRIEDRWIGFIFSQKVQKLFNRKTLSAGRVQTPVLGWIIDRFVKYRNSIQYFIRVDTEKISFVIDELEIKNKKELDEIIEKIKSSKVIIKKKEYFEEERNPLPPYITNTMLNDAIRILGLGANQVMQIAQDLFELGFITYHRTDSTRVSPVGLALAKEYISEKFGEEYYKGRVWGEGGAHECIRPTKPWDPETLRRMIAEGEIEVARPLTKNHFALYSLIFNRFIASQMKPIRVKKVKYLIEIPEIGYKKEIEGIVDVIDHGWDLVLKNIIEQDKIEDIELGELEIKDIKYWKGAKEKLYTQADVISLMREKEIGRPSTYAQIMQKLLDRKYVIERRRKLIPTPLGIKVFTYLNYKYGSFVSEERTRELEKKMDMIENGEADYEEVLKETFKEMENVRKIEDNYAELRRILGEKLEEFSKKVRLGIRKRRYRIRRYRIR